MRLYVKDADGEPLKERKFVLQVEGQNDVPGSTDADGLVQAPVPPGATAGRLEFTDDGLVFSLQLGNLDPLKERTGVRARLANLGFHCPESSDAKEQDDSIGYAIARLQSEHGLDVTGEIDEPTLALLQQNHDCGEES